MVNHELITLLTDEKLDIDAALRGSGDGIQQRFVRNEIWAGDRDRAPRSRRSHWLLSPWRKVWPFAPSDDSKGPE
jgi:hypothetical protein